MCTLTVTQSHCDTVTVYTVKVTVRECDYECVHRDTVTDDSVHRDSVKVTVTVYTVSVLWLCTQCQCDSECDCVHSGIVAKWQSGCQHVHSGVTA